MINQRLSTKLSALALALLLAGCGGGGSDGYYNTGPKPGTDDPEKPVIEPDEEIVEEQPIIEISSAESTLNPNGGDFEVTVRLTDNNGGGISGKEVTLDLLHKSKNDQFSDYFSYRSISHIRLSLLHELLKSKNTAKPAV